MTADLSRLAELAKAATPGPWHSDNHGPVRCSRVEKAAICWPRHNVDVDYIAAASPDVVLDLLARLQQAEEAREAAVEQWECEISRADAAEERAEQAEATVARVAGVCVRVARDDEEHLNTFGQHGDPVTSERETLACVATGHEPMLCDCNDAYRDPEDKFCEYAQETFTAVEALIAARVAAALTKQAEDIAAALLDARGMHWTDRSRAARIAREFGQRKEADHG